LVHRVQNSKDRRKWHVHLTPRGRALKAKLIPLARQVVDSAVQGLSRKEVGQLLEALAEVQKNLHADICEFDEIDSRMVE
jgi:DNA-binding MarR family transcriptional regulator